MFNKLEIFGITVISIIGCAVIEYNKTKRTLNNLDHIAECGSEILGERMSILHEYEKAHPNVKMTPELYAKVINDWYNKHKSSL